MTAFLKWLSEREQARSFISLESLLEEQGGSDKAAVVIVDLLEGFCRQGPLASPRINDLIDPTVRFLTEAHRLGVEHFFFPSDTHTPDCPEFQTFPAHCVKGSDESALVSEIAALSFSQKFQRIEKNSISSLISTDLGERLKALDLRTIICAGDCTDLCLYHLAAGVRFLANAENLPWRVVVPANLVATFDVPFEEGQYSGPPPHPADFLGDVFFYHLDFIGVDVVGGFQ